MEIDCTQLKPRDAYALLISVILPRPIAWVSTLSAAGRGNLAPYSFFQGVTANPPTLLVVVANKRDGEPRALRARGGDERHLGLAAPR
jgi:flavin reductase (DIM6/NTAB) family NADH-FMN oxidoreductase RutF